MRALLRETARGERESERRGNANRRAGCGAVRERREVFVFALAELLEESVRDDTSSRVDGELELTDFGVDVLHELNDEIDQLLLLHILNVEVGNEE